MTINATGAATKLGNVAFGGANLTITGDQNLTITDALEATTTDIDASAASGKVTISAANTTDKANVGGVDITDQTIKGGSGNDTITSLEIRVSR